MSRHLHYCGCGVLCECRREDCELDWTCPTCEDEHMAEWLAAHGDQGRLPLTLDEPTDNTQLPLPMEMM